MNVMCVVCVVVVYLMLSRSSLVKLVLNMGPFMISNVNLIIQVKLFIM